MEDQFGGRTDDDLFADDFEPIVEEVATDPARENPSSFSSEQALEANSSATSRYTNAPVPSPETAPASTSARLAPRGIANSKYNDDAPSSQPASEPEVAASNEDDSTASQAAPTDPASSRSRPRDDKKSGAALPGQNTALKPEARLQSGANPRQKLTDDELTARMERMRLKNAETTRKFERAEADQRTHEEAYARGMEQARKKKQADEERKKRGEEERKRMNDERAKNRERKLKAMENKDGGWDQGKREEQEDIRRFRGEHGGVRGAKGLGSLNDSRYAFETNDDNNDGYKYGARGRQNGRGRGRGNNERGRGPRGARGNDFRTGINDFDTSSRATANGTNEHPAKPVVGQEDFPALPGVDSQTPEAPLGAWGDEMDAFDAKRAAKS